MAQEKTAMRFLFGDRELMLAVADLLAAPVDVIVKPADSALQHQSDLAQQIRQLAGGRLQQESEQLIREYGRIDAGMAVYTSAGNLPFKAIIHAVGPEAGEGDKQRKLEQLVSRSLQLCEMNEWSSIGFPALEIGHPDMPVAMTAQAFFRAITRFWDARHECAVAKVIVLLHQEQFRPFFDAFREQGFTTEAVSDGFPASDSEGVVGEIDLSEADLSDLDNTDIDSWFK
jgi:O-acetyl-ADP-ribose deacetylase (regulator of RNase III)